MTRGTKRHFGPAEFETGFQLVLGADPADHRGLDQWSVGFLEETPELNALDDGPVLVVPIAVRFPGRVIAGIIDIRKDEILVLEVILAQA